MAETYFNLHKRTFSIRNRGKVYAHRDFVCMMDVKFVVQPAGHARVLRTGQKNVHAFCRGIDTGKNVHFESFDRGIFDVWQRVHYNPRRGAHFTDDKGRALKSADQVTLYKGQKGKPIMWAKGLKYQPIEVN